MARNRYAGKTYGTSKTAQYYKKNKAARAKKRKYDKEYDKQPWRRKAQAILKAIRRKNGTDGNGDMMDESHTSETKTKKDQRNTPKCFQKAPKMPPKWHQKGSKMTPGGLLGPTFS